MPISDLQQSPMMNHLLQALQQKQDIGHYGRLVFAMVGQYFLSEEEIIQLLAKDPDCDQEKAQSILK